MGRRRLRARPGRTRRRVRANGGSKTAAKAALDTKLERRPTFTGSPITGTMTVTELVTRWLAQHAERITPQTRDKYLRLLKNQIKPGIGNLRIAEATTGRIDTFLRNVAEKTPALARHSRTVLSLAFALAVRHDAISANPVRETESVAKKRGEIHVLDDAGLAELRAILDRWQRGRDKHTGEAVYTTRPRADDVLDVVDLLVATGARIGELLALRWRDVNLADDPTLIDTGEGTDHRTATEPSTGAEAEPSAALAAPGPSDEAAGPSTVTICGTMTWVNGAGLIRQDHPKTASGWRTITLPDFAVDLLRRYLAERRPGPDDPVLPSHSGTFRSPNNLRRQLRDALAGTPFEWVTPHTFRRTVATVLDRERSTEQAAAQLGHSGTAVTKAHYIAKAHRAPDSSDVLQAFARPPDRPAPPRGRSL